LERQPQEDYWFFISKIRQRSVKNTYTSGI
jgi:hypothetical protein